MAGISDRYAPDFPTRYWQRSQQPLQALVFLLPALVFYEVGVFGFAKSADLFAEEMIQKIFNGLGVASYHLPPLVVVVLLLSWHVVRRDRWSCEAKIFVVMFLESVVLISPLLVLGMLLPDRLLAVAESWQTELVQSIGAGIYEELIFRLMAIALLHSLLVDRMKIPHRWGAACAITISSLAFASVHFFKIEFELGLFIFFTMAGFYLAAIYLLRGFGIVVGTHAIYNVVARLATDLSI